MASTSSSSNVFHDLVALLSSLGREFLIRNNGDRVKICHLVGKKVGLYFSGSWCGPCRRFTTVLVESYKQLIISSKGDFEVVFVSSDLDDEAFDDHFGEMPWLAVPFSDTKTLEHLEEHFKVKAIPCLLILDGTGEVSSDEGVWIINVYGAESYPFTPERISVLREEEEAAKKDQSLKSILVSGSRDFLISSNGNKVVVSELEGKMVGLYFCMTAYTRCLEFTTKLAEVYKELAEHKGENFEVVLLPLDDDEEVSKKGFETMPWLALPFKDESCGKLVRYFEVSDLPTLVIIGPDGKTLNPNGAQLVEEHGAEAYPFTPEKINELHEIEKAKFDGQTLESILVSGDMDFVIQKSGYKVPVSDLVGKNIFLYFSAKWFPPCRVFQSQLIEIYQEIKAKDSEFEVIFISSDHDQSSFNEFFSTMTWLALPFDDPRKGFLQSRFRIRGIPAVVAIGPSCGTLTAQATTRLLQAHGADSYPFTEEHWKQLEKQMEEFEKVLPEKVKFHKRLHADSEHELRLIRVDAYICHVCEKIGRLWCFRCQDCEFGFFLHPECALGRRRRRRNNFNG